MIDIEMINAIEEWGFEIEKEDEKYKLYHEDAVEITTFSDYLGDEFEKYLIDKGIQTYDYDNSDIEEFFEQYGIEVY